MRRAKVKNLRVVLVLCSEDVLFASGTSGPSSLLILSILLVSPCRKHLKVNGPSCLVRKSSRVKDPIPDL